MKKIPYGKHFIDKKDIDSVKKVLLSNSITQGPTILEFEKKVAKYVQSKYAVAVSSCTAGMHISMIACGFKKNSKLLTSPITFVSTANVALFCGGKVDFADIDKETINLSLREIKKKIKDKKYDVVIPVHFSGNAFDTKKLKKILDKKTKIIEDAAHGLGSKYKDGSMVGSCKYSDATVFSFHPVKTIACGEGGIVTTNNINIYKKLLRLRSHGINKLDDTYLLKEQAYTKKRLNPWYYEMQELGYHYRMTEIQAALGISQLNKINKFILKRKIIAKKYYQQIHNKKCNFDVAQISNYSKSSNHLFIIKLNLNKIKKTRAQIMYDLQKRGIQTQVHYIPVPIHPFYKKFNFNLSKIKNAMNYYDSCLSIPIYYSLTNKQQKYVLKNLEDLVK